MQMSPSNLLSPTRKKTQPAVTAEKTSRKRTSG